MTLSILLTLENNIGIFASSFLAIMSNKMAIWLILICLMYNVDATPAQHIELQVFVRSVSLDSEILLAHELFLGSCKFCYTLLKSYKEL